MPPTCSRRTISARVTRGMWGCSKNPTAVRSALIRNNVSPDVWVHEFGHGQGQSDDNNCPAYIMNISASNTNVVTSAHCTKFRTLKQPYHLGGTCGGSSPPSAANSFFVPQSSSPSSPGGRVC